MLGKGTPTAPCEEIIDRDLAIVRLNDQEHLAEPLKPWPPPEGLAREDDPFVRVEESAGPDLLLADEKPRESKAWAFTRERAVTISVLLHLLLVLFLILAPPSAPRPEKKLSELPDPLGIIQLLSSEPPAPPIPVQFFPAPGQKAPAPGRNPLPSDKNRIAHGGDPAFPKAPVPKAVAQAGIRDLDPGKRGAEAQPASPQSAPPPQAGSSDPAASLAEALRGGLLKPKGEDGSGKAPRALKGIPTAALSGLTAEQVAEAVREQGRGGDEGGGYEREGGFVDSGPLSFDTQGYDFGAYADAMIRKIKRNWDVPALAYYGVKGRVTIRFFIRKDGHVEDERILSPSGIPPFDNAAFQAIAHASPFRPLPDDLGKDREGVTVTFFYNIRPEDVRTRPEGAPPR